MRSFIINCRNKLQIKNKDGCWKWQEHKLNSKCLWVVDKALVSSSDGLWLVILKSVYCAFVCCCVIVGKWSSQMDQQSRWNLNPLTCQSLSVLSLSFSLGLIVLLWHSELFDYPLIPFQNVIISRVGFWNVFSTQTKLISQGFPHRYGAKVQHPNPFLGQMNVRSMCRASKLMKCRYLDLKIVVQK